MIYSPEIMDTTKSSIPGFLDRGIYLEDSDILLEWNSSRDVLLQLSQPQSEEQAGGRQGILWSNRRWLAGMSTTFYVSLKKNEPLRRIEVWPSPRNKMADEFQRFSRHLALQLGTATRKTERPGQHSRYWERNYVKISLKLNERPDILGLLISYHGPKPFTAIDQNASEQSFDRQLRQLGLNMGQWYNLKNYLLDLQAGFTPLPPAAELQDHPVVQLALQFQQTRDRSYLDRAAGKLAGSINQAWLMLDKS